MPARAIASIGVFGCTGTPESSIGTPDTTTSAHSAWAIGASSTATPAACPAFHRRIVALISATEDCPTPIFVACSLSCADPLPESR